MKVEDIALSIYPEARNHNNTYQFSQRQWWPIGLAHAQALVDDLIKLGTSSSGKKLV